MDRRTDQGLTRIDQIVEHCRGVLERGSRSFARAAALFPRDSREAGYQLYAWCRHCDDLIDGQSMGHPVPMSVRVAERATDADRLATLRTETERAIRGEQCDQLVFQGLGRIVRRFGIPAKHPFEFLDGMAMDVAGRRYQTIDDLEVYCYHVAGVVGVMAGHIMGIKDAPTLRRLADLGIAMQMTNISRDVRDDAQAGRVYLPLGWLAAEGLAPDEVEAPPARARVTAVVHRLLDRADVRYRAGNGGFPGLPFRSAWAIAAARDIYREIGQVIRRRGEAAWDRRVVVPEWRKYLFLLTSLVRR